LQGRVYYAPKTFVSLIESKISPTATSVFIRLLNDSLQPFSPRLPRQSASVPRTPLLTQAAHGM